MLSEKKNAVKMLCYAKGVNTAVTKDLTEEGIVDWINSDTDARHHLSYRSRACHHR